MIERDMDLVGIGIGPSNLSIAALLHDVPGIEAAFFDRKPRFDWHPGLMFKDARMQTSYLKDLVTGVSPTNPYSFMNYLVRTGRFYQFLSAEVDAAGRREFAGYLAWAAGQIDGLHFGTDVHELRFEGEHFVIRHARGTTRARNVTLGTGRAPYIPECAAPVLGERCFHAIDILERMPHMTGARVAIVGGGQTGAEVFLNALRGLWGTPDEISWFSRRPNFEPLDETPFTNELFMPGYVRMFHRLHDQRRQALVAEQKLAGDGISPSTLREIYRALYDQQIDADGPAVALLPAREVTGMHAGGQDIRLVSRNQLDDAHEHYTADIVVLCTGLEERLPAYLAPLRDRLNLDVHGRLRLGSEFDVDWDGPAENRIYALNMGRFTHGIAEPQLSLAAWRSAMVINHALGRPWFDVDDGAGLVRWRQEDTRRKQAIGM